MAREAAVSACRAPICPSAGHSPLCMIRATFTPGPSWMFVPLAQNSSPIAVPQRNARSGSKLAAIACWASEREEGGWGQCLHSRAIGCAVRNLRVTTTTASWSRGWCRLWGWVSDRGSVEARRRRAGRFPGNPPKKRTQILAGHCPIETLSDHKCLRNRYCGCTLRWGRSRA